MHKFHMFKIHQVVYFMGGTKARTLATVSKKGILVKPLATQTMF